MEKTLCNLNGMVAQCDGAGWHFDEQKKYCYGAKRSSHNDSCMHLCEGDRCDSHTVQDLAIKLKK
ncbi:MAG: hypothetical protein JRJ39_02195 [Deltaproteobacteria bacterium]|nr:hypothetical protein [Deltaproteobacteria bacterium]